MPISLHKDLASGGWHSSVVTTYSVDPSFYDLYVERRLRTHGCENNILMADARMLKRALEATPEGFAAAGTRYAVVPVKVSGAFHPKVHMRLGERKCRVIVGSANATAAGWGRNQEVVATLEWRLDGGDQPDNAAFGALAARAYAYLERWLSAAPGDVMRYKLQLLRRKSPWLQDLQPSDAPIDLNDGTAVGLLCESGGDSPSILRQFSELVREDEIRRAVVVSPYWDAGLSGLRALRSALGTPQTFVAINPHSGTFPVDALPKKDALKFVAFEGSDAERFLHAKVVVVETRQADHVLFGSANCSDDALGLLSAPARNAEACIYRRLPPRSILGELGIDLRRTLERDSLSLPASQTAQDSDAESVPAGEMELLGRTLTWWPPSADARGATIRIKSADLATKALSQAKWTAELVETPAFPVIARVAYGDGRLSDPVIVHGAARLRRAAPSDINAALSDALSKVRKGEADLLELALQAHVIFAPDPQRETSGSPNRSGKRAERPEKAVQYATPEEFRSAVSMREASGTTGLFAHDDPGLQEVLSIIMHGINASKPTATGDDLDDSVDDADLLAGDTEDDDSALGISDEDAPNSHSMPEPKGKGRKEGFTGEEVLQRRTQLLRALDRFYELLKDLSETPSKVSARIAGQTMFFLWLIRYGCRFEHPGVTRGPTRLMVLCPGSDAEREHSFVIRAMWILMALWRGKNAIASHIQVDPRHGELHDDLYGFVVHSRWALARAYLLALEHGDASLAQRIAAAALEILNATHRLGPVDAAAESRTMTELDADLGCSPDQTEALLRCCREFEAAAKLKMAAAPAPSKTQESTKTPARRK